MEGTAEPSPRRLARVAGVFYLLTFLTGIPALFLRGASGVATGLAAGACYIVVTLLFYSLFRPASRTLSLLAALVGLVGCVIGPLRLVHLVPLQVNSLVFFGCYCLLIGYLILRSTFLPRILGVLMALGGLGWLTFLSAPLAKQLSPYNMIPGIIGEASLTLWLLVFGIDGPRWMEQARGDRILDSAPG
jgi:hypothetical protein